MRYGILSLLVLAALFSTPHADAQRRLNSISSKCSSVTTLPNGGFIYKNSAPLRRGGIGTPIVGFRREPTLIGNRSMSRGTTSIFAANGTKIGSCPWTSAHGHAGGRYRCTMQTSALRRAARRAAGSPTVYFKTGGASCVKVPDAGRCYGSVKGLCNQLIS